MQAPWSLGMVPGTKRRSVPGYGWTTTLAVMPAGGRTDNRDLRCGSRRHRRLREPVEVADRASLVAQGAATRSPRPVAGHPAGPVGGRPAVAGAGHCAIADVPCAHDGGAGRRLRPGGLPCRRVAARLCSTTGCGRLPPAKGVERLRVHRAMLCGYRECARSHHAMTCGVCRIRARRDRSAMRRRHRGHARSPGSSPQTAGLRADRTCDRHRVEQARSSLRTTCKHRRRCRRL